MPDSPIVRRLLPGPPAAVDIDGLFGAYAYPSGGPWLRANMVASLDGAAIVDGRAEGLSGAADKLVFAVLRALSDVILVGASTVRTEGYRPALTPPAYAGRRAAAGQPPAPPLAVVSNRLELDPASPLFTAAPPGYPTIVVTSEAADADRRRALARAAEVVVAGADRVDLPAALEALAARGLTRVLCEGGPTLLAQVTAASRLDELCLTVSPLLVGGNALRSLAGAALDPPRRLQLAHLLEADGFLFTRYAAVR